jgi:hypothetical protein
MVTEIRGTTRYGKPTLRSISAAIYKARIEALARSMNPAINKNAKDASPVGTLPDSIGHTYPDYRIYGHPETIVSHRAQATNYGSTGFQRPASRSRRWHDSTQHGPNNHHPKWDHPPAPSAHHHTDAGNGAPQDNGLRRPMMLPRLEDTTAVYRATTVAASAKRPLDHRYTRIHPPLATPVGPNWVA